MEVGFIKGFPLPLMFISFEFWQQSKNRSFYGTRFISDLFFPAVPSQNCPEKGHWFESVVIICSTALCWHLLLRYRRNGRNKNRIYPSLQYSLASLTMLLNAACWLLDCCLMVNHIPRILCCSALNLIFYCNTLTNLRFCLYWAAYSSTLLMNTMKDPCPYKNITSTAKAVLVFYFFLFIPFFLLL